MGPGVLFEEDSPAVGLCLWFGDSGPYWALCTLLHGFIQNTAIPSDLPSELTYFLI